MKIESIEYKGKETVYDIETPCHNYILKGGLISHNSMSLYDPLKIAGGRGLYYASSSLVLGSSKAKLKESSSSTDISGALILAKTEKSRFCKELTKLKYMIKYEGGIHPTYGILEDLLEGGFITKPTQGFYSRACVKDDKKWREKQIWDNWKEFFEPILADKEVHDYFMKKYTFEHSEIEDEDFELLSSD